VEAGIHGNWTEPFDQESAQKGKTAETAKRLVGKKRGWVLGTLVFGQQTSSTRFVDSFNVVLAEC
jgi:hypothetical protein